LEWSWEYRELGEFHRTRSHPERGQGTPKYPLTELAKDESASGREDGGRCNQEAERLGKAFSSGPDINAGG